MSRQKKNEYWIKLFGFVLRQIQFDDIYVFEVANDQNTQCENYIDSNWITHVYQMFKWTQRKSCYMLNELPIRKNGANNQIHYPKFYWTVIGDNETVFKHISMNEQVRCLVRFNTINGDNDNVRYDELWIVGIE